MKVFTILTAIFTMNILAGCEKKTVVYEENKIYESVENPFFVTGFTESWYDSYYDSVFSDGLVAVYNNGYVPLIMIDSILPNDFSLNYYYFYGNGVSFKNGLTCDLMVCVGADTASASAKMADFFDVIQPAKNETITSSTMNIRWNTGCVDHYDIYIYYHYHDEQNRHFAKDTTIHDFTDTTYTSANFLPAMLPGYTWWGGFVGVIGVDGPQTKPGTPGNIAGKGFGFYRSYFYSEGSWYYMSVPAGRADSISADAQRMPVYYREKYQNEVRSTLNLSLN